MTPLDSFFQDETFGFQISVISEPSPRLWRLTGELPLQIDRLSPSCWVIKQRPWEDSQERPQPQWTCVAVGLKPGEQLDSLSCVLQIRSLQIKSEQPISFPQAGTMHFSGKMKLQLPKVRANSEKQQLSFAKEAGTVSLLRYKIQPGNSDTSSLSRTVVNSSACVLSPG